MSTATSEGEHVKEVFAYFGRAYYSANVLETGLAIAVLFGDFLRKVGRDYIATGGQGFDRAVYEAEFDAFLANQHAQAMGSLIKRVTASTALSDDLKAKIAEANRRRIFLAHHYFRERAIEFVQPAGREQMIAELDEHAEFFEATDEQLQAEVGAIRRELGIDEDQFERWIERYMQARRIKSGPGEDGRPA